MINILDILKKIALFEGLEDSDLSKIGQVVKERLCPKGTVLFKEGDIGDAFYLIKDVFVKQTFLETLNVNKRCEMATAILEEEIKTIKSS